MSIQRPADEDSPRVYIKTAAVAWTGRTRSNFGDNGTRQREYGSAGVDEDEVKELCSRLKGRDPERERGADQEAEK